MHVEELEQVPQPKIREQLMQEARPFKKAF